MSKLSHLRRGLRRRRARDDEPPRAALPPERIDLLRLQRELGNRAVRGMVEGGMSEGAEAGRSKAGEPLDNALRRRIQAALGEASLETMELIRVEVETWNTVARSTVFVPTLQRARVIQHIELLLVHHGNDLSAAERAFWETMLRAFLEAAPRCSAGEQAPEE